MRVFSAGIATETNTFATLPTGMGHFALGGIHRRGQAREDLGLQPTERRLRELAKEGGHELIEGLMAHAQPLGRTEQTVWEALRDELLADLRAHLPVQAVILLLHGAMVAEGCDDCEGELITRVRAIVGPAVPIGVELDLHCHTSAAMLQDATVLIAYKEYPHVDRVERLEEVWRQPVDLRVTVRAVRERHVQHFGQRSGREQADCGAAAWVSTDSGLDLVIIGQRQQVFGRDLFTGLGIELERKRAIVVKSSQHFHADFAPIASRVFYADTPGLLRSDLENMVFQRRSSNFWPRVPDPWAGWGRQTTL